MHRDCSYTALRAAHLCYGGQTYLIIVDCFMDWPDIILIGHDTTANHLEAILLSHCHSRLTGFGLIMAHSLRLNFFETSPNNEVSFIELHHPIIHKVMAKLRILLSPWKRSLLRIPHGMTIHLMKTSSVVPYRNTPST